MPSTVRTRSPRLHAAQISVKLIASHGATHDSADAIAAAIGCCLAEQSARAFEYHVRPDAIMDVYMDLLDIFPTHAVCVDAVLG